MTTNTRTYRLVFTDADIHKLEMAMFTLNFLSQHDGELAQVDGCMGSVVAVAAEKLEELYAALMEAMPRA